MSVRKNFAKIEIKIIVYVNLLNAKVLHHEKKERGLFFASVMIIQAFAVTIILEKFKN